MSNYTAQSASAGASLAALITLFNTSESNTATKLNDGLAGGASGSGNNIAATTVTRENMAVSASPNRFFGEILAGNAEIRDGGTVTKVSGLVFATANADFFVLDDTNQDLYRIAKTSVPNDSVIANRDTYMDIGIDGVIDKNAVAPAATAPSTAANHKRFAKIESSASIHTITMLGNTTFTSAAYPEDFIGGLRLVSPDGSASAATTLTLKSGLRCRDSTDAYNIDLDADVNAVITSSGAGGLDTGAEASSKWYAAHALADSSGANTTKLILSLSSSAPTKPSGYDIWRRVGWVRNDGSGHFVGLRQEMNVVNLDRLVNALTNGSTTSYTDIDLSTILPSTAYRVMVMCRPKVGGNASTNVRFRKNGTGIDDGQEFAQTDASGVEMSDHLLLDTDTGRIVEYKRLEASGFNMNVTGYVDSLHLP